MEIAIIGLGLIGGSFAKAISKRTQHMCYGMDINKNVVKKAIADNVIASELNQNNISKMNMFIICLHPKQTIQYILDNKDKFPEGSIIIDTCGIKEEIYNTVGEELSQRNVTFIGCHPMAGREFSGYEYSLETLYDNASFIMTSDKTTSGKAFETVKKLALEVGFKEIIVTTPNEHDRTIAYTSQLAHIASNAYVKSPSLKKQNGFTGGSFQDLTRVAKLNEDMWTDLFMMNKENLLAELGMYIENLTKYYQALQNNDEITLKRLLKDGRILKESIND